jgi:subtilisin family serine protease
LAAVATPPIARAVVTTGPATLTRSESIIVLRPDASPAEVAHRHGLRIGERYETVFNGFGAAGAGPDPGDIAADPDVTAVLPNQAFHLDDRFLDGPAAGATPLPTISDLSRARIGIYASPTAAVAFDDGPGVDADIAVIDTGIDPRHPDLNVAGGHNCTTPDRDAWQDDNGHGTAVAGVAAMKDNGRGGVGVAPGARLWSVKIFDRTGAGSLESFLCGVEWVTDHATALDVANMSFGGGGTQDNACGQTDGDLMHGAICRLTQGNVTVVAAAGNEGFDATHLTPAAYPEVITVSAFNDTDGRPGGLGPVSPCDQITADDQLARFSNFGEAVDIAAPGICIPSSFPLFLCQDGAECYGTMSGTSLSAPFVSGAAALLRARHPDWGPVEIRGFLLASAEAGPILADEADAYHEGILSVVGY